MSKLFVEVPKSEDVQCEHEDCDVTLPKMEMKRYKKQWYCKEHFNEVKASSRAIVRPKEEVAEKTWFAEPIPDWVQKESNKNKVKFVIEHVGTRYDTFAYEDVMGCAEEAFPHDMTFHTVERYVRWWVKWGLIVRIDGEKGFFQLKKKFVEHAMDGTR